MAPIGSSYRTTPSMSFPKRSCNGCSRHRNAASSRRPPRRPRFGRFSDFLSGAAHGPKSTARRKPKSIARAHRTVISTYGEPQTSKLSPGCAPPASCFYQSSSFRFKDRIDASFRLHVANTILWAFSVAASNAPAHRGRVMPPLARGGRRWHAHG